MKYADTSNTPRAPDVIRNIDVVSPRTNNIIDIVAAKKTIKDGKRKLPEVSSRVGLIELTEKLAEDARNGSLKGLGGFADYDTDYMLGLEGSYLTNPESAILPVRRLERRIMDQIIEQED